MSVQTVEISQFLELRRSLPAVDVRAPIEFEKARIEGAHSVPLFDDQQRSRIGTVYKQTGREEAIQLGLKLAGPRLDGIVEAVRNVCVEFGPDRNAAGAAASEILLYCARGGMRSESVAWLLNQADFDVHRLSGGYKSYRKHVHELFEKRFQLLALTGMTGSGKTRLLLELEKKGEQVVDLEGLARHRGSAFGGIGQGEQPPTEHFENLLFEKLSSLDPRRRIWVEDESRSIGRCVVPQPFFDQLHGAPAISVEIDREERADFLVTEYGDLPTDEMIAATGRIAKRLGGQNVNSVIEALEQGDLKRCAEILLVYYDKTYSICRDKNPRSRVLPVELTGLDPESRTEALLAAADRFQSDLQ